MIDVGAKPKTERVAIARGFVSMAPATLARLRRGDVEKGDVLAAARLAGVMAAKRTPDLVPLCHPIALSAVDVAADPRRGGVEIVATVRTVDRTGVEMEALAAVSAACLTAYDMLKRYERGMRTRRRRDRRDGPDGGPDRRRDGGARGGLGGVPHRLRHAEAVRARDADRGGGAAGEVRRPDGRLATARPYGRYPTNAWRGSVRRPGVGKNASTTSTAPAAIVESARNGEA